MVGKKREAKRRKLSGKNFNILASEFLKKNGEINERGKFKNS